MDEELGDGILHQDEFCTCVVQRAQILVSPSRRIQRLAEASAQERTALLDAVARARDFLARRHPTHAVRVSWIEPPATSRTATGLAIHVATDSRIAPENTDCALPSILQDAPHHRGLVRGQEDPLLDHLTACFPQAQRVDIAVAFILDRGVALLRPYLEDLLARGGKLRVVTGDYFGVTEPNGLDSLLDLEGDRTLRVFESGGQSYHPKSYLFSFRDEEGIAFVGSSNLSQVALGNGVEWNYRVLRSRDDDGFASVAEGFDELLHHPKTTELTHEWVNTYRATRKPKAPERQGVAPEEEDPPNPHPIQMKALSALRETRAQGNAAGLVVLATGLGKTWLSAFDSKNFERVLFVAHREEILEQARQTFRRIRPQADLGLYTGKEKVPDAEVLFASIQTLGRTRHLRDFTADRFDYIIVDEFHHAAARTYRLLLEHFTPQFLLGLTATPERTDGADLLALCGNNVVFRCDLGEGVANSLLSPFAYLGVPDDVDYDQIPWRSSRFDENELTRQLATQKRAQNALEQLAKHGGRRTLAFCASQAHADFMAEFFRHKGKRAVAVHSGETSAPRANSLEQLRRSDLDVLFSVDMFNEGVDLPDVDTVLMLRPTESRILWLQQFGRGLRKVEGKCLQVIDYIGNHRSFLEKPRALLGSLLHIGEGHEALRNALRRIRIGDVELPEGCSITYELQTLEILDHLLPSTRGEDKLRAGYIEFRERHGRRPTAAELHNSDILNWSSLRKAARSWFDYVAQKGDLSTEEEQLLEDHRHFFREVEQSRMNRSYKMLLLQAMLELDALPGEADIEQLAERFQRIANRSPLLRQELAATLSGERTLVSMVKQDPIRAWLGIRRARSSAFFEEDDNQFGTTFTVPDSLRPAFANLVRELVDWQLAEYLDRASGRTFECRVTHNSSNQPILMLPHRDQNPGIPEGPVRISTEGELFEASFVKIAINVMRRRSKDASENALPELLRYWFGHDAGSNNSKERVRFTATKDGYEMAPVTHSSELLTVCGPDGRELDAHFKVESMGRLAAVIYMSRGGAKGSPEARNTDYTPGLDALLERARNLDLALADALIDSKEARLQPRDQRRLDLGETGLPLDLTVASADQVRRWMARGQRKLGRNTTRQLRLIFARRGADLPEDLGPRLARGTTA